MLRNGRRVLSCSQQHPGQLIYHPDGHEVPVVRTMEDPAWEFRLLFYEDGIVGWEPKEEVSDAGADVERDPGVPQLPGE